LFSESTITVTSGSSGIFKDAPAFLSFSNFDFHHTEDFKLIRKFMYGEAPQVESDECLA